MPSSAFAEVLSYQFSNPITLEYDTNPLMDDKGAESIWKRRINPRLAVTRITELDTLSASLAYIIERNSDQNIAMDREDPTLGANWSRNFQRGTLGATLGYSESSSRDSNLEETGRAGGDNTRKSRTAGLNGAYEFSELWSITGNLSYSRLTFDGDGTASRSYAGGANLDYEYSERLQPFIGLSANRYSPDDGTPSTNLYGSTIGINWQPTEMLNASFYAGMNMATGSVNDSDWQGGANLKYIQEKHSFSSSISRSVSPAGNGGFIQSEMLSAGWSHALSDLSNMGADISLRRNLGGNSIQVGDTTSGSDDSENYRYNLWYSRELSERWNLRTSWQHKKTKNTDEEASGDVLSLSVSYNFDSLK